MKQIIVVLFLALMTEFAFSQAPQATDPAELTRLREGWKRAKEQANSPIDRKYVEALKELKTQLTKAGNLEGALWVEAELKKIPLDPPAMALGAKRQLTEEMLTFGEWKFEMRATNYSRIFLFSPDHSLKMKGAKESWGTWKITSRIMRMEHGKQWNEFDIDLDESEGTLMVHEFKSNVGKRAGVIFIRQPAH